MYNLNDYSVLATLNSRLFPDHKNFLVQCMETARHKYSCNYIYINTDPFANLERRFITMTRLFREEQPPDQAFPSPIFFDLNARE